MDAPRFHVAPTEGLWPNDMTLLDYDNLPGDYLFNFDSEWMIGGKIPLAHTFIHLTIFSMYSDEEDACEWTLPSFGPSVSGAGNSRVVLEYSTQDANWYYFERPAARVASNGVSVVLGISRQGYDNNGRAALRFLMYDDEKYVNLVQPSSADFRWIPKTDSDMGDRTHCKCLFPNFNHPTLPTLYRPGAFWAFNRRPDTWAGGATITLSGWEDGSLIGNVCRECEVWDRVIDYIPPSGPSGGGATRGDGYYLGYSAGPSGPIAVPPGSCTTRGRANGALAVFDYLDPIRGSQNPAEFVMVQVWGESDSAGMVQGRVPRRDLMQLDLGPDSDLSAVSAHLQYYNSVGSGPPPCENGTILVEYK